MNLMDMRAIVRRDLHDETRIITAGQMMNWTGTLRMP